jgi:hypothetical protein
VRPRCDLCRSVRGFAAAKPPPRLNGRRDPYYAFNAARSAGFAHTSDRTAAIVSRARVDTTTARALRKCGVAAVWRSHCPASRRGLTHDRHGVPRCKHCDGPTEQVRFSANGGKPRIWVRCIPQTTTDCAAEQTISCSADWRLLVPLPRTVALYHELKESHQTYEAAHDYWRDRYRVGADELGVRPKIVGLGWHRLRANVACLVDWTAARHGWPRRALRPAGEEARDRAGHTALRGVSSGGRQHRDRTPLRRPVARKCTATATRSPTALISSGAKTGLLNSRTTSRPD